MCSCAAPTYLTPNENYSYIVNKGTFCIQNMDNMGQVEPQSLTAHYEGFDVRYKFTDDFTPILEIVNKTNKALIIDKSKCYVLYNGYSRDLFKDVRSSRSTTYNNVQDAINNVQTNEASVTMSIPAYSKWELPVAESNVKSLESFPKYMTEPGTYPVSVYDNPEPVEFVIPYSFDYSLAKWDTSRNRVYVGQIDVYSQEEYVASSPRIQGENNYLFAELKKQNLIKEYVDWINEENIKKWKSHRRKAIGAHIFNGIVFAPYFLFGPLFVWLNSDNCKSGHSPIIYNSDGTFRRYDKHNAFEAEY